MLARRASQGLALFLLLISLSPAIADGPSFFEPKEGFYKARGSKVTVAWSLDRTEVPEAGVLTATLTIRGATNPHEIIRPDLRKARTQDGGTFADLFQIEDVPAPPAAIDAKEVRFGYFLKPRGTS